MSTQPNKTHPGRKGLKVSLAPLTPDQALAAALQVKPGDLKKTDNLAKVARKKAKMRLHKGQ